MKSTDYENHFQTELHRYALSGNSVELVKAFQALAAELEYQEGRGEVDADSLMGIRTRLARSALELQRPLAEIFGLYQEMCHTAGKDAVSVAFAPMRMQFSPHDVREIPNSFIDPAAFEESPIGVALGKLKAAFAR